jgi:hypothetical protein
MGDPVVRLTEADWQKVLQILATASWQQVNGLIMNIGAQLAAQAPKPAIAKGNGAAVEAAPDA